MFDSVLLPDALISRIADYIEKYYVETVETYDAIESVGYAPQQPRKKSVSVWASAEKQTGAPRAAAVPNTLEEALKAEDIGFSEALLKLIDKTGKKDSEIYKKANISKQHFSKIRINPNYKPTKPTAIALALALELDLEQTKELIGRAGYALTNSSKFDLIIQFFIQNQKYDVVEINMALYKFDQSLLGM